MNELVSIIMPVETISNLKRSIRSIVKQSYKNWELIIIAEKDKYRKEIECVIYKFNNPKIKLIHKRNDSSMSSVSLGFTNSQGQFIIYNSPYFVSKRDRVKTQLKYLKENNEFGMVSCLIKSITEEKKMRGYLKDYDKIQNFYNSSERIEKAVIDGYIPLKLSSVMIRRAVIYDLKMKNEKLFFEKEVELLIELLMISNVTKIRKVLCYYRYTDNNNPFEDIGKINLKERINKSNFQSIMKNKEYYKEILNSEIKPLDNNYESNIRVLMIIDELSIGGTETHLLTLVKELIKAGIYVSVLSSGGILEEVFNGYGIHVFRLPLKKTFISEDKLKLSLETKKIVDTERINIIHCHLSKSMEIGSIIYNIYHIPYLVTLHGMFYSREVIQKTCLDSKAVIAVSNPVKDLFNEYAKGNYKGIIEVIVNGVDTNYYKPETEHGAIREKLGISKDSKVILYCSRLDFGKSLIAEKFIDACKILSYTHPYLQWVIIGGGSNEEHIKRLVEEVNNLLRRKVIHMLSARYDMLSYYLESDIVVGTGRVALEAMSCSRHVIAAGSRGCLGLIDKNKEQLMYDSYFGDHSSCEMQAASSIVDSIDTLLKSSIKDHNIGNWCRQWCIDKFQSRQETEKIIEIYKKIPLRLM